MRAFNIEWDIDIQEALERLDEMSVQKAAEGLAVLEECYGNMNTEERHDYAFSLFHHCPAALEEFMGLPDSVEIPDVLEDDGDIAEWLSAKFGYCLRTFSLSD